MAKKKPIQHIDQNKKIYSDGEVYDPDYKCRKIQSKKINQ